MVHSLVKAFGLLSTDRVSSSHLRLLRPTPASVNDLAAYHTRDYLEFVLNPKNSAEAVSQNSIEFGLEDDCPPFPGLPAYVRLVAGATLTAVNALQKDGVDIAICWDGGRHHAQKSHASGFCYVADCILALLSLKKSRIPLITGGTRKPRIMYLDLDLHFSDAVSQSFVSSASLTPQILTFSIHHAAPGFFPSSAMAALSDPSDPCFDPFTLSIPLERGASKSTFSRVWPCVERIQNAFRPDYLVVQCGVDGLAGDPHSTWNWTLTDGEGSLGWCIERICSQQGCKVLLLGGGGYNSPNAARAWSYLTSVALGSPLPPDADIPDHAAFPAYAPSFTLDIPPGHVKDENSAEYLEEVRVRFDRIAEMIEGKIASA